MLAGLWVLSTQIFLSTLSLRRATRAVSHQTARKNYFYPRSPCGERRSSDIREPLQGFNFYPRSPCGERLLWVLRKVPILGIFLSTLSLRRATRRKTADMSKRLIFLSTLSLRRATEIPNQRQIDQKNFYPRSPCGERLDGSKSSIAEVSISIHALLAESDREPTALRTPHHKFLSTLSLRRATRESTSIKPIFSISIHALLAESDSEHCER